MYKLVTVCRRRSLESSAGDKFIANVLSWEMYSDLTEANYVAAASTARLHANGFAIIPPSRETGLMMHAPFALLPRPVS